jgi:hypothetical protein
MNSLFPLFYINLTAEELTSQIDNQYYPIQHVVFQCGNHI